MERKDFEWKIDSIKEGRFAGYGSVFDVVDQGGDLVAKSAFDKSLASGRRPRMLWNHDSTNLIGVWDKISVDEKGLKVEGHLLMDLAKAKEAHVLLQAGALDGLSIGYKTIDYVVEKKDGQSIRILKEVDLWEISLVTFPMNVEAMVTDVKQLQSPREVEQLLRKAGVPGAFAKLVSLHGFEEATRRLNDDHRDDDDEAKVQASIKRLLTEIHGLKEMINA